MYLRYICRHCDALKCETSTCPVCGGRTELLTPVIYWDKQNNVPVVSDSYQGEVSDINLEKIGSSVRPVYPQERLLIELIWGTPMKYAESSVWAINNNTYIIDGIKKKLNYKAYLAEHPVSEIRKHLQAYKNVNSRYENQYLQSYPVLKFIELNRIHIEELTGEAINYIQNLCKNKPLDELFVSFSGGKDSTVTSDLVMKALGTQGILHFYGDTTLEYPDSARYLNRFRQSHPYTPVLVAKNEDQNFLDMCEVIGPPSRVIRWCCTVFKTGAISHKIESVFRNKKKIISFQGIRRNESKSRNKYERETESPKIAKQVAASPIIDWFDTDIWLYIFANNLDVNDAYKKGFTRVGCWCCPNNSEWSAFLADIYLEKESKEFQDFLYSFAKGIGKPDWKEYIDTGKWKARQGGNGLDASQNPVVSYTPCALEERTYNFELNRPISKQLYTLFKPFGILNFTMGKQRLNEVFVLDRKTGAPILRLSGRMGSYLLKISILGKHPAFKSQKIIESLLRAQITKYQSCLACTGCQSACKFGAITVRNMGNGSLSRDTIHYEIDDTKCVGCMECISHYDSGCYMYKVLKTSK